ncbi:MAG TPA: nucleotide pyrophosphohydrolase [Candidatus Saccharimonadales bacterium]|nr:nucleotide pyrophosphohydrolase [Candidatus Saccharimonadales bacterium]
MKRDDATTIQELKSLVVQFRDERGWKEGHTPKNLSMSIAIEAAELMEHFQWDTYRRDDKQGIADELADIISYCLNLADILDIDVATTFRDKLDRARVKYPVELFNPSAKNNEAYHKIKKAYREGKK